jgi:enoyl-CoA hydratase/carnithine racemase
MQRINRNDTGAVAHLEMNVPGSLNALSDGMISDLTQALDDIAADPAIRAVILSGAGKAFCAGHDLKEMTAARAAPDKGAAYFALMQRIITLPQPVIAMPHGIATAAGCQMVATCDLAIAAEGTRFGVNGVNIGLFCSTPMVALSRNIPRKQAFEMLTTGQFIDTGRAAELGLINRAVPHEEQLDQTMQLAQTIAAKLGSAVKIGKRAFYEQLEKPLKEAYAFTGQVMVENMLDADTAEGINAFIEKRDPNWTQP